MTHTALPELGDTRLLFYNPKQIGGVAISDFVFVDELSDDISSQYRAADVPALVPDMRTSRPLTPEERSHYTHYVGDVPLADRRTSDVVIVDEGRSKGYLTAALEQGQWELMAQHSSGPNELTTTRNNDLEGKLEGAHPDAGAAFSHRIGLCVLGERSFLAGTHSAQLLLGERPPGSYATGDLLRLLYENRGMLRTLRCLNIPLSPMRLYDAWTGAIVHDGQAISQRSSMVFWRDMTVKG